MAYQIPYLKYEFNNSTIDENLFRYLKSNTSEQIISDFEKFKEQTRSDFNKEWKTEKLVYEISATTFVIVLVVFIYQIATESKSEILGYIMLLFFLLSLVCFMLIHMD
jgi:predicted membrane channel-forming protein YqfA (hemolysin III family)